MSHLVPGNPASECSLQARTTASQFFNNHLRDSRRWTARAHHGSPVIEIFEVSEVRVPAPQRTESPHKMLKARFVLSPQTIESPQRIEPPLRKTESPQTIESPQRIEVPHGVDGNETVFVTGL